MKKGLITLLIALILVIGGIFAFLKLSEAPKETLSKDFKEAAVSKLLGRKAQLDVVTEDQGTTIYNGKYITFEYPKRAVIYTYRDPQYKSISSYLEEFIFDLKKEKITVDMQVLANNGGIASIEENPGVSLRHSQSASYNESDIMLDGQKGKEFTKKNEGSEKTVFFLVNNRIYSLAVTGSYFDDVNTTFDQIIQTIKFKD